MSNLKAFLSRYAPTISCRIFSFWLDPEIFTNLQSPLIHQTTVGQIWNIKDKRLWEASNQTYQSHTYKWIRTAPLFLMSCLFFPVSLFTPGLCPYSFLWTHVNVKNKDLIIKNTSYHVFRVLEASSLSILSLLEDHSMFLLRLAD